MNIPRIINYLSCIQQIDFPKKLGFCELIFGKFIANKEVCEVLTGAGLRWKLDLRNPTHRWILYGLYDPPFLKWAKHFLKSDAIVVDSGANIGQTVMYLGQWVPHGKLYAFEPGKAATAWLEEGLQKNREFLASTQVHRLALGSKAQSLFLEDTWKAEKFHGGSSQISEFQGEPIRVVRLEDFLKERNVDHVDLWKLDVEGYELEALKGAEGLLKTNKIKALYVELCRETTDRFREEGRRIRDYLSNFGYDCYIFSGFFKNLKREKSLTNNANGLFLPER
ncbi:MAG: hypothetical protein AUJ72_06255 [Candidatus Omnitrophica bacterium CG1_02_46_14]|nr:MAG: hypothetical protein AUJ72_06255 [Candidatus Omnitrophica bacterium CG1_02_46_14]